MNGLFNTTFSVQRITEGAVDDYNRPTETPSLVVEDQPGRIQTVNVSARNQERIAGARAVGVTHILYCDPDVDMTEKDRIIDAGSVTYEIKYMNKRPGGVANHHWEIELKEVRT